MKQNPSAGYKHTWKIGCLITLNGNGFEVVNKGRDVNMWTHEDILGPRTAAAFDDSNELKTIDEKFKHLFI